MGTRTAQDLYNDIEGQRNDVDINLPAIPEEMPGGTNETDEHVQYKVAENYPLKQPKSYGEVLLVSFSEVKPVLEQKVGLKCDESYLEDGAMEKLNKNVRSKHLYKYIFVNLDEKIIVIERFGRAIKSLFVENNIKPDQVKMYAFSSNLSDKLK